MQYKWFLFFSVLTKAALVFSSVIPVKVIYDGGVSHRVYARNLDEITRGETQKLDEYASIQEIVKNGVQGIENNLKSSHQAVEPHVWNSFNEGIDNFLKSIQNNNALKQSSNSTSIVSQLQNFANNFFAQFGQNNTSQQQSPQTPIGFFQNGISQIQSGISNIFSRPQTTSATILSTSTNQNVATNDLNPQQQPYQAVQSPNPPTQNVVNTSNSNPFANRPILNAINYFNPFRQTTTKPDSSSTSVINTESLGNAQTSLPPILPTQTGSNSNNQSLNPFANRPILNALNFFNPFRQTTKMPATTTLSPSIAPIGITGNPGLNQINSINGVNTPLPGNSLGTQTSSVLPSNSVESGNNLIGGMHHLANVVNTNQFEG